MNTYQNNFYIYLSEKSQDNLLMGLIKYKKDNHNFQLTVNNILNKLSTKQIRKKGINFNVTQIEFLLSIYVYFDKELMEKLAYKYNQYICKLKQQEKI